MLEIEISVRGSLAPTLATIVFSDENPSRRTKILPVTPDFKIRLSADQKSGGTGRI